jgi:hypothetical protein
MRPSTMRVAGWNGLPEVARHIRGSGFTDLSRNRDDLRPYLCRSDFGHASGMIKLTGTTAELAVDDRY